MKASMIGFLAASALGLASASAVAEDPARIRTAVYTENTTAQVEVVALNQDQAIRLQSERKRHQEALEKLKEEHERTIEAILAASN